MNKLRSRDPTPLSVSSLPFIFSSLLLFHSSSLRSFARMGDIQIQMQERTVTPSGSPTVAAIATDQSAVLATKPKSWHWWLAVALCTFLVLAGQTVGTLLGRFYYDHGGNSKWIGPLVTTATFPLLLPPLLLSSPRGAPVLRPSGKLCLIYAAIGIVATADNVMYSYGLLYLPVSTYALVSATSLAFNAVFSYYINSQRFTSLIFNSVVLLTFSAALLAVRPEDSPDVPRGKYPLGFALTLAASAVFSLVLSLTQLAFQKVIKKETLAAVLEWSVCVDFVAAVAATAGLFTSGEWSALKGEMERFGKGRAVYVATLVAGGMSWTVANVGAVGLTFAVSSLFSNVISTLGLPVVPIFAVVFFGDRMDGVKVVAMLIAVWGFLSYVYQDYLDDSRAKKASESNTTRVPIPVDEDRSFKHVAKGVQ